MRKITIALLVGLLLVLVGMGIASNILTAKVIANGESVHFLSMTAFFVDHPDHPSYPSISATIAIGIPFYMHGLQSHGDGPDQGDTIRFSCFTFFGNRIFVSEREP